MTYRALAVEVAYLREGRQPGHMFVGLNIDTLELTTPMYIIQIEPQHAFDLWMEIGRLMGYKNGPP